jgi:hypothetical protein
MKVVGAYNSVRGLPAYLLYIKWICRGGSSPFRRSYLDQQWRTQYVIGERILYIIIIVIEITNV